MKTLTEFNDWQLDTTRDASRVLLIELDYALNASVAQGSAPRTDAGAVLPAVKLLVLRNSTTTDGKVRFEPPFDPPPGTRWEVWVNGRVHTILSASPWVVEFRAPASSTVNVIVVAVNAMGAYGPVTEAELYFTRRQGRVFGRRGHWHDYAPVTPTVDDEPPATVGTVRLASQPWLDTYRGTAYDNWLRGRPEIEDSLTNFAGVGDIEAINPDPRIDWLSLDFRGHETRWLYGDVDWVYSDFRRIASTLSESCRSVGNGDLYQFDQTDGGRRFRRTFTDEPYVFVRAGKGAINHITDLAGLRRVSFIRVESTRDWQVNLDFSPETTVGEALRLIVRSLGARIRVRQDGGVDVFRPDTRFSGDVTITEHDVVRGSLQMTDTIQPYAWIVVEYAGGETAPIPTGARTGMLRDTLRDTLRVRTVLEDRVDARFLADELADYHRTTHRTWSMGLIAAAHLLQVGDVIDIDHPRLVARGVVQVVQRAPLSLATTIEVTI